MNLNLRYCYTTTMKKKGPYILIGGLFLIVTFIAGLQYGKQVEKANKIITAVLSISPTSPQKPLEISYIRFEHAQCGVSFVYPSLISVIKQSSSSALLENKQAEEKIELNCDPVVTNVNNINMATESAKIAGKEVTINILDKKMIDFTLTNSKTGKRIHFVASYNLLPLFEETLTFL